MWKIATVAWVTALAGGGFALTRYATTPGPQGTAPRVWPPDAPWPRGPKATLLLFAHPACPCTRASLWEAERLAQVGGGALHVHVLFRPAGDMVPEPAGTDLWEIAVRAAHVTPQVDAGGRWAARFGAETSGHGLLYDFHGRLRYAGGVTSSRGHLGPNIGSDRVLDVLAGRIEDTVTQGEVFGCELR